MALTVDASTPAIAFASNDPWVTASFTPPNGSLLVVVCMGDWFAGTPTLTPTSAGLTFVSQRKQGANNQGVCQIFTAEVGSNGGTPRTVSVTTSIGSDVGGVKVYVVTGQHPTSPVDATNGGTATTNNLTVNAVTTGFDGCWVFGGGTEWQSLGVPTSADVGEGRDDSDLSVLCVRKSAATASAGSVVTFNFDAGGSGTARWTWAAISIRPAEDAPAADGAGEATQEEQTSTVTGQLGYGGSVAAVQAGDTSAVISTLLDSGGADMAQGAGYSFNSGTVDGATVRDLAGYFMHGQITGSAAIASAGGKYGDGLNCTGGALRVGPIDQFFYPVNSDGGLSVAAWVKLNTTTAAARCIASASSSSTLNWAVYASNASGNVEVKVAGTTYSTSTSLRDGAFHHVMLVHDKVASTDTITVYVDGASVLSTTATTSLAYTGNVTMEVGRNVVTSTEALDGIVDDFRWWNDPVEASSVASVVAAEQTDFQYAIYSFADDSAADSSVYGRDLTVAGTATFDVGLYGRAISASATEAAASGTVDFGDVDRLAVSGWMRLDTAPTDAAVPFLSIRDSSDTEMVRAVVNVDRTITATWVTIHGTYSVTSGSALTVGQWSRFQVAMNPTYVNIRLNSATQSTTNSTNPTPHLSPTVLDLQTLWLGGDDTSGGQVSFDYVTFTKNFLDTLGDLYWSGPPTSSPSKPANLPRGVYEFNENTGTTTNDVSGNGNHLTLTSGGSWVTGVEGSALGSTGSSPNGVAARLASGLVWDASPDGWAFSGWVKCHAGSSGARFLVLRNSTSEVAHAFYLSGTFQLRLYGASGNTGIINPTGGGLTAETWTHVAASCNGDRIQFYLNGERYGSAGYTVGALLSPTELDVGGDTADGAVADMDSLALFDTPIGPADARWLFENPGSLMAAPDVDEFTAAVAVTQANQAAAAAGTVESSSPPAAVAYRSSTKFPANSLDEEGTSCVVPVPADAAAGDIALLAVELNGGGNPTVTWPSGFTEKINLVNTDLKLKVAWKRLTGADTGNYTVSWTGSQFNQGQCVLLSGAVDSGDPIETSNTGVGTAVTAVPPVTVTTTNSVFLVHFASTLNFRVSTQPTGYTRVQDANYLDTSYVVAGAAGSQTATGGTVASVTDHAVALLAVLPGESSGFTGEAEATQANQTSAASGVLGYTGAAAVTQATQSSAAAGVLGYTGSVAATQAGQTAAIAAAVTYIGSVAATQTSQTATAAGELTFTGSVAAGQSNQTGSAVGAVTYTGSVVGVQASQTATATGLLTYTATVDAAQADQVPAITGTVVAFGFEAEVSATQGNQTGSATGVLGYTGSVASSQAGQVAVAAGLVVAEGFEGFGAAVQASQTANATGVLGYVGAVAVSQAGNVAAATGTVMVSPEGTVDAVQADQAATVIGITYIPIFGLITAAQANNAAFTAGLVFTPIVGVVAASQQDQIGHGSGSGARTERLHQGTTPRIAAGTTPRL